MILEFQFDKMYILNYNIPITYEMPLCIPTQVAKVKAILLAESSSSKLMVV